MYQYKHLVVFTQLGPPFRVCSDTHTHTHTPTQTHTVHVVIACLFFFF